MDGAGGSCAQIRDPSGGVCMQSWLIGVEQNHPVVPNSVEDISAVHALRSVLDFLLKCQVRGGPQTVKKSWLAENEYVNS